MKRIILMLALSIGASMAVAGDINTAQYDSVSGLLQLPRVSVDGGKATYSVTLQNRVHSIGGYLFDLDQGNYYLICFSFEPFPSSIDLRCLKWHLAVELLIPLNLSVSLQPLKVTTLSPFSNQVIISMWISLKSGQYNGIAITGANLPFLIAHWFRPYQRLRFGMIMILGATTVGMEMTQTVPTGNGPF